jgi:hypothetical protein
MAFTPIHPTAQWVKEHDEKISRMLIKNPWNDPMVKKIGLYDMYVIDAVCEALELSAEEDASTKLGCMNPKYSYLHGLLSDYLEKPTSDCFAEIMRFSEIHLGRRLNLVSWILPEGKDADGYWPDIRVLDTPDECLSWLLKTGGSR